MNVLWMNEIGFIQYFSSHILFNKWFVCKMIWAGLGTSRFLNSSDHFCEHQHFFVSHEILSK